MKKEIMENTKQRRQFMLRLNQELKQDLKNIKGSLLLITGFDLNNSDVFETMVEIVNHQLNLKGNKAITEAKEFTKKETSKGVIR